MNEKMIKVKTPGRPLSRHKKVLDDQWSVSSKIKLMKFAVHKIKRLYVSILEALDLELSSGSMDKKTHGRLRSVVLDNANDQIRNLKNELENRYNVEFVPYHIDMKVVDMEDIDED